MALHNGPIYHTGDVALAPPVPASIRAADCADDVMEPVSTWLGEAEGLETVYYFSILLNGQLVGQIFLHDIDERAKEALIGYHLFEPRWRGRGIGAQALEILQRFILEETALSRLILITSADNPASRRAAEKAGFVYMGPPREDPTGVLLVWEATASRARPTAISAPP